MKKGVSAVIAIILILMITVALAAMAYVWFTSIFQEISEGAGQAAAGTTQAIGTSFVLEAASYTYVADGNATIKIAVRNTGTNTLSGIAVYLDSDFIEVVEDIIEPGIVTEIEATETDLAECTAGNKISVKVTSETGYTQTILATCK